MEKTKKKDKTYYMFLEASDSSIASSDNTRFTGSRRATKIRINSTEF